MLTKKEKVISSILCVISVILLIASLCFTTVLFTTHGTTMKAEAAVDITSDQYAEYFSEDIYPNGFQFSDDNTNFGSYESDYGGYSTSIDINNVLWEHPFRLDVAYRCNVVMSDGTYLYDETFVFFPSAYNADGTLYWGFHFTVENFDVSFNFLESYIQIIIYCGSNYYVDYFHLFEVPSLTTSSFYTSYESLYLSDGWGFLTDSYYHNSQFDFFFCDSYSFEDELTFPCFLMIESNVGNLLVYFNPNFSSDFGPFRIVGIPNNFYTFCTYNEDPTIDCFAVLNNYSFDSDFAFEFDKICLVAPVPINQSSGDDQPPINESLGEVLLQGMTFGFDSIGEGITYTVNNLFFDEEGKLSTFTYVIVFTLGIGIVLGFIKWILSYILSLGGKD